MKTPSIILTLSLTSVTLLTVCTSSPTQPVVYRSDWHQEWQYDVMGMCYNASIIFTLKAYDQSVLKEVVWTEKDVDRVQRLLYTECLYQHDLFI